MSFVKEIEVERGQNGFGEMKDMMRENNILKEGEQEENIYWKIVEDQVLSQVWRFKGDLQVFSSGGWENNKVDRIKTSWREVNVGRWQNIF